MNAESVLLVVTTSVLALCLVGCQPGTEGSVEAPAESADITATVGVVEVTTAEDAPDDFAFVAPSQLASGWTTSA